MEKPPWLRLKYKFTPQLKNVRNTLSENNLNTVCHEALCPNCNECWSAGTATFMILGDTCTRNCRFCATKTHPKPAKPDKKEPEKIAKAVNDLKLKYAVITSVDRDDLGDLGSGHFAKTVKKIKEINPKTKVEVLIPDFQGNKKCLEKIVQSGVDVVGHNVETVRRFTSRIRDRRATYERSLDVLKTIKKIDKSQLTKSSLMVGFGETPLEVFASLRHMRKAGVDLITIGQYLSPSSKHAKVVEYVLPEMFEAYEREAWRLGFKFVASGPFVRSSYKAAEYFVLNGLC